MAVTTARIVSLLNYMEHKQLLLRYPDPNDNRQVVVVLTDTGRETIRKIRTEVISYVCTMLEELGPEDAQANKKLRPQPQSIYSGGVFLMKMKDFNQEISEVP